MRTKEDLQRDLEEVKLKLTLIARYRQKATFPISDEINETLLKTTKELYIDLEEIQKKIDLL